MLIIKILNFFKLSIGRKSDLHKIFYRLRILDVNVVARWKCIKYAIPLLKKSKMPRVVNIASRLGSRPMDSSVAYCTSESATKEI